MTKGDELIRRGDALAAVQLGDTVTRIQARIAALPAALPAVAQGVTRDKLAQMISDCTLAAKVMQDTSTFETGQSILKECAAIFAALATALATWEARK